MNRHMSIIAENNVSVAWIEYLPDYVELQVWKKKKKDHSQIKSLLTLIPLQGWGQTHS